MVYEKMLQAMRPLRHRIFQHPFNLGLADGSLSYALFERFLHQDKYYLYEFSRVLGKIGARFPDSERQALFKKLSHDAFTTQDHLHLKYLAPTKTPGFFQPQPVMILPAIQAYVDYLHQTANEAPIAEAVASCKPCFYIYGTLGHRMKAGGIVSNNPFELWIQSYSSKNFLNSGQRMREMVNQLAAEPGVDEHKMIAAFVTSVQHEIAMWDAVYQDDLACNDRCYAPEVRFTK